MTAELIVCKITYKGSIVVRTAIQYSQAFPSVLALIYGESKTWKFDDVRHAYTEWEKEGSISME
jgi:hypothetical protein